MSQRRLQARQTGGEDGLGMKRCTSSILAAAAAAVGGLGRGGEEEDLIAYSWIRVSDELGRRDVSKSKLRPGPLMQ